MDLCKSRRQENSPHEGTQQAHLVASTRHPSRRFIAFKPPHGRTAPTAVVDDRIDIVASRFLDEFSKIPVRFPWIGEAPKECEVMHDRLTQRGPNRVHHALVDGICRDEGVHDAKRRISWGV